MSLPIEIHGLTRRFGVRVALDSVDLNVQEREVVGLVGPNGSGKTTLLSIVAGLLRPHSGQVRVFGLDPVTDGPSMLERTRFAFAPPAFFPELTPREQLKFLTQIGSASTPKVTPAEIDATLDVVGLLERAKDRVGTFSMGMKQRLALAQALLPRPELIVLDEPTEGLDPLAVLDLRDALTNLRSEFGTAILLSSHLMIEVEQLVDRLLVLREGKSLFYGKPDELLRGKEHLRLVVAEGMLERAKGAFEAQGFSVDVSGGELCLELGALSLEQAGSVLRAADVTLLEYRSHRPTLEEALLERLRQGAGGTAQ
ncbi:MAG: ABC-2 type transport system ATP-binding protein [Planctomycetota bacterium]|jgi:ABC-2 type transport system ATP-binding protein